MFELFFELVVGGLYDGLRSLGLPPWLAGGTLVAGFAAVIAAVVYFALG
jgi:hypothetical protein